MNESDNFDVSKADIDDNRLRESSFNLFIFIFVSVLYMSRYTCIKAIICKACIYLVNIF